MRTMPWDMENLDSDSGLEELFAEVDGLGEEWDEFELEGERRGRRPRRIASRRSRPIGRRRPRPVRRPSSRRRSGPRLPTRVTRVRARPRRAVRVRAPAQNCICPAHGTEFVRWVQSSLNQVLGLPLRVNGVMNRATRDALREFQKREGLPVDGIAGPETEKALIDSKRNRQINGLPQEPEYSYDLNISAELEAKESRWRMRPPVRYQGNEYICWAAAISSWSIVTKGVKKFKTTKSVLDYFRPTGAMNADNSIILPNGMEEVVRLFGLKFKKFKGGGSLSAINIGPLLKHSHLLVVFKRPGADYHHFVVAYGVDRFYICFMDPELNPADPSLNETRRNRVCARIDHFGAGATEFFVFWKE